MSFNCVTVFYCNELRYFSFLIIYINCTFRCLEKKIINHDGQKRYFETIQVVRVDTTVSRDETGFDGQLFLQNTVKI